MGQPSQAFHLPLRKTLRAEAPSSFQLGPRSGAYTGLSGSTQLSLGNCQTWLLRTHRMTGSTSVQLAMFCTPPHKCKWPVDRPMGRGSHEGPALVSACSAHSLTSSLTAAPALRAALRAARKDCLLTAPQLLPAQCPPPSSLAVSQL